LVSKLTTPEGRTAQRGPAEPPPADRPLPTNLAQLQLEIVRRKLEWGKTRRAGGGTLRSLTAMVQWLVARLNALRPVRAMQQYNLQRGPLLSAGIGFNMFFSITGLLTTGFSIAGLLLRDQPALLDRIVSSVSAAAPGLLTTEGREGLVAPEELLNPDGLGWTAVIAAVVTVVTSLRWIGGMRGGLRIIHELPPLTMNPVLLKLKEAGILLLLGVALVVSAGASLVFGTAAGWLTEQFRLDALLSGPLTTSIKIAVPLVLAWVTAVIMFRLAGGLRLSLRALLEGTILAALGTGVLQIFSTELLASAGRNPILAPFAIIIGLLIWFNLVSQVYLMAAAWSKVREEDLKRAPAGKITGWGPRRVQPGKTPVDPERALEATVRRRGTDRPKQK
jgi:membrane protein